MFMPSQKVVCVDDTNPNPLCTFPCGYVVQGRVYIVRGMALSGGVQIEGLPVIGHPRVSLAAWKRVPSENVSVIDAGWKPRRFRSYDDQETSEEVGDSQELELVGAGSGR